MNYEETLTYIHNTPKFARTLGNDLLRKLLERLGNPHKNLKFVHIAGTNGKGSAAVMLSEILCAAGYKTGLFTSPYIERFNERIKLNGEMIEDDRLAQITTRIRMTIEKFKTPVSEFALDTAIALEYFNEEDCDIVVLETGLGGRLDATNVIEESLVSVIMSIGFDHTQYLGKTIAEITAEKCGIIKSGGNTVVYPVQEKDALSVIAETCNMQNNTLHIANMPESEENGDFRYNNKKYTLSLLGEFQKYNAATVLKTTEVLKSLGFKIPMSAIRKGLKSAFNPARLEKLNARIYLDGAHNPPAAAVLKTALKSMNKPVNLCVAMMEDKDISRCVEIFAETADKVIVTELDIPRCARTETLAEKFLKYNKEVITEKDPERAVKCLMEITSDRDVGCICGSLYLAGEVRGTFRKEKRQTPYYVYILRCSDNSLYTGITTDVERRFQEHLVGEAKGAKYTKTHKPISIEAYFKKENRSAALKTEYEIKQMTKPQKEELIKTFREENRRKG